MKSWKLVASAGLLSFAAVSFTSNAALALTYYDDGHGKEWRQVTDTQGINWSDLASVCPLNGISSCAGSVDGVNVDGWVFASVSQVGDLFSYFGDHPGGINIAFAPQATSHAGQFLDTAIGQTYSDNIFRAVFGWTSTPTPGGSIWVSEVIDRTQPDDQNSDVWSTADNFGPGQSDTVGAWMWRPVLSAVPEPSTWAMLILGFGGIGLTLRGKARKAATASV